MKKFLSLLFTFIIASSLFSVSPKIMDISVGITTGVPLYGNGETIILKDKIVNPNRVIIGTLVNLNLNPNDYFTFYTGTELLCDFCWNSNINANFFHTTFPLGVKLFPAKGGLSLGIAYTLGFCGISTKDSFGIKKNYLTPWGNGLKISTEYDFSRISKYSYLPTLGISWNLMPRGNYSFDNIFTFYLTMHF